MVNLWDDIIWLVVTGTWIIMVNLWLIMANNWNNNISGWWFGTMEFYDFPYIGDGIIIPTDELTPSFFRGVGLYHQPDIYFRHQFI